MNRSHLEGLHSRAFEEYTNSNFNSSKQCLLELCSLNVTNLHTRLNEALLAYKESNFCQTAAYREALQRVAVELNVNLDAWMRDLSSAFILYNYAVLNFHACQYRAASRILQDLLDAVIDSGEKAKYRDLLREICFLLTEIALITCQGGKAFEYILALEETCGLKVESKSEKKGSPGHSEESHRYRLQLYKIRCNLLYNNTKQYKKDIKGLSVFPSIQSFQQALFKAHQEYLKCNFAKSVKHLSNVSSNPEGSVAVSLPSYADTGYCIQAIMYNSLGCIEGKMGKHNLALTYFRKALTLYERDYMSMKQQREQPLYTVYQIWRYYFLHNIGITLLKCGHPKLAFQVLLEVLHVFHNNPRLWLRVAEACMRAYQPDNETHFKLNAKHSELVRGVIGVGPHRKLVVNFKPEPPATYLSCVRQPFPGSHETPPSIGVPTLSLEFAVACLRNSLALLKDQSEDSFAPTVDVAQAESIGVLSAAPGSLLTSDEIARLRCSTLCALAYTTLCVGDNEAALFAAEKLLSQPSLNSVHRLLAHLYAAEALILLQRPSEALAHLNLNNITDLNVEELNPLRSKDDSEGKTSQPDEPPWYPRTFTSAKIVIQYNLAFTFAVRNEFGKAMDCLLKLRDFGSPEIPIQAIMLSLYLQLQMENLTSFLSILGMLPSKTVAVINCECEL